MVQLNEGLLTLYRLLQRHVLWMARRFLTCATFACTFFVAALLASSASAQATPDSTAGARSVSAFSGQSEQHITIPLVPGLKPQAVKGTISVTGRAEGLVRVTVPGAVLLEAPAASTVTLDAVLAAANVSDQHLVLGLQYVPGPGAVCGDPSSVATLGAISIVSDGSEVLPTTVAEFLAPGVPAILLPVPDDPNEDVSVGILAVAGAMAHRYPDAQIVAIPDSEFPTQVASLPAGSRTIRVASDDGNVSTSVSAADARPTLTLAGHGDELRAAGMALASDTAALADDSAVSNMTMSLQAAPRLEQSLQALGASNMKLAGHGTQETYLGISQSRFGGPVSSWSVHLKGTHTAIPAGGQAALTVYWNDHIVSSRILEGDRFEVKADVPEGKVQARNGMRLRLTALPSSGNCTGGSTLPMEMTLDTTESTVSGVRGHSVAPGFERFPQVLGHRLPVAYDGGASTQANTINAAMLVATLQRQASELLDVLKVEAGALLGSSDSGLLVGATADTANRLSAPLRLSGFRTVNAGNLQYGVEASAPFGVLEAFEHNGRNILMLGAWVPDGDPNSSHALQRSLAAYVHQQDGGWAALSRNLLLTQSAGKPVMLDSTAVVPQQEVADSYRPYALWLGVVVAILGLALFLRNWLMRRHRKQAHTFAEATERAAAADHDN